MKNAAFSLEEFIFNQVWIDLERKTSNDIKISILPNGTFFKKDSVYELVLNFKSYNDQIENHFISIQCKSLFNFEEETKFEEIPDYFYTNCIAIIFPYLRGFISNVTLQANIAPIILPTLNLVSLKENLIENTVLKD